MKHKYRLLWSLIFFSFRLFAQNEPIGQQAEEGTLGAEFTSQADGDIQYITISTNLAGTNPGTEERVSTYELTFPAAGTYDLFAKIRVGAGAAEDDSFFSANSFGTKTPDNDADWMVVNNIHTAGFTQPEQVVSGAGSAQTEVWKWINVSEILNEASPVTFTVEEGSLTQTFLLAAREDGLDIDQLAFGLSDLYYTVANLENGEAGSSEPPADNSGETSPIAEGQPKYLGNIYSSSQLPEFENYWNQVTPENAGKWASVERTRDQMNWSGLDAAYKLARDNGFPFRFHVLIWGNQQPSWIEDLPAEEQLAEIEEWYAAVAARYPDLERIEVVNEPVNDPPSSAGNQGGNYIEALGGTGTTGWDWVLNSFRLAREYFPNAELMLNEYNVVNGGVMNNYLELVELLHAEDLIDAVGAQAHAFSTRNIPTSTLTNNLNRLAAAAPGLPIVITEMDIDGATDEIQLKEYQRVFPIFWEHEAVEGVTLWGYRPGMWRTEQEAYLITADGTERPALLWLRDYVAGNVVLVNAIEITSPANSVEIGETLQLSATVNPEDATVAHYNWSVEQVSGSNGEATIDENGLLTAVEGGEVKVVATAIDGSGVSGEKIIEITGGPTAVGPEINKAFAVYPNPITNGSFRIKGALQLKSLRVLDFSGKEVKQLNFSKQPNSAIELQVAPGIYLLQLIDGKDVVFKRIIVQ